MRPLAMLVLATLTSRALFAQTDGTTAGPLVTGEWLAARLGDPTIVILHVGERYASGHIPGAHESGGRYFATDETEPLPAEEIRSHLVQLGATDQSHFVIYHAGDALLEATRIVWTLDNLGLGSRASLLNGGLDRWTRDGRTVTREAPVPKAGRLAPFATPARSVDAAYVQRQIRTTGVTIVDARSPVFFDGPAHMGMKAGHIPGAVSIPFSDMTDQRGAFRSRAELETAFRRAGVKPGDTVIAYCHVGLQATAVILAARLLGHPTLLYDGSFHDWSDRNLPVEGGKLSPQ